MQYNNSNRAHGAHTLSVPSLIFPHEISFEEDTSLTVKVTKSALLIKAST